MNENVFREYDIRGVVESDFPDSFVYDLGRAYATFLIENQENKISVSGDIRNSTIKLKANFIRGLIDSGINVFDLGIIPTPLNYFSLFRTDIHHSVQITGSHNPPEFNGFKFSFDKKPFFSNKIQYLKKIIKSNSFRKNNIKGTLLNLDIIEDYKNYIGDNINIEKAISCVMDCGNATGSLIAPDIFKLFDINLKQMYCNVDETFPNHHPDPTVDTNLDDIVNVIKRGNYDLGIAYDGDADRLVAIDELGNIIRPDILMAVFIPSIIKEGESVVYDVKCSRSLDETILKYAARPVMYKTGHSLIKNKMIELKSKFGGEMSGHLFFADKFYGFDDGIYASLRLIELLSSSEFTLSELVSKIPSYYSSPEIRIDCENDDKKFEIVQKVVNYFKNKYPCNLIDGIRIEFDSGWGLIRCSNTQPVIVCRFEADTPESMEEIKNIIFNKMREFGDFNIAI